jgi:diacylglycerol kinase (ATP)
MTTRTIRVVVNPRAGAGAARRALPALEAALRARGVAYAIAPTTAPGDGARLAREAARDGVDVIAVVGGDGTLNEVAQAFLGPDGAACDGPSLVMITGGTGGDYRRTFGLPMRPADALARVFEGRCVPVDLGRLRLRAPGGAELTRAFLNVASFGLGGVTDALVNSAPKWLGARGSFFVGALRALARYRNAHVRVCLDGAPFYEGPVVNVALALGSDFGGGMRIAPDADPSDGAFDVVVIGDLSVARSLALTTRIYRGTHLACHGVTTARARRVEAWPLDNGPVLIDADGETPGVLPLDADVLAGAVRLWV